MKQTIETANANAVAVEVASRLRNFNEQHAGPLRHQRLVLSVRDDAGVLVGGLSADFHWNSLYVDVIWVDAQHRKMGVGTSLLRQAEDIARQKSYELIYLSTFQFQAPDFYSKHGYKLVGKLQGTPPNSSRQWFAKVLN